VASSWPAVVTLSSYTYGWTTRQVENVPMSKKRSARATNNRLSPEKHLERLLHNPRKDLAWYYTLGKAVTEIAPIDDEVHYGQDKMEGLLRRFRRLRPGLSPLLHGSRHLVSAYKPRDLKRLSQLPWSHVARLASIADPATRKRLERRCIANKWTFLQLIDHYREELGIRPSGGRSAKPLQDVGPISTLSETIRLTDQWLRSYERRLEPLESRLWRAPPKKHTLSLRQLVAKTIGRVEEIEKAVSDSRKKLHGLRARIDRTLGAPRKQGMNRGKSAGRRT
jgi:hypothetical protein